MNFADLLRRYREEAGLSQNALARAAGLDPTHLNRMERAKQGRPRKETVLRLIRGLGWSLTDERAQHLLQAAGLGKSPQSISPAVLAAPRHPSQRPPEVILRELKLALLRTVDLVTELEEELAREEDR